ncbi:hypothetical protein SESBI_49780 [Sesbania bispinosa]|nr:hypothetical protein SESBI_49780 [Sesbania bispinosa]
MVKSHPSSSHMASEDSSSSSDSSSELIPRSISCVAFLFSPSSGNDFFKDSLITPSVFREEALLFHDIPGTLTHTVGPSLLRSRLIRGEFPWMPCTYVARASITGCWAEWVEHVFTNDLLFVDLMKKIGIVDAVKLSPRLSVNKRVEDLNCLVQRWSHITHTFFAAWGEFTPTLEDVAKELKATTLESARYSWEFLTKLRSKPPSSSNSKTPPRKVRGTGNILPPDSKKRPRESLKYTFATWIRYFFGDIDKGTFYPGPSLSQPLRRAAFLTFWLSKYVFPGPPWESVSPSVFTMACLLAEGVRLPLASLFLGGSTCFPEYAPVRMVPDPPPKGEILPLQPKVWSWSMGRPRHSLLHLLDEEDQFVHRPFVTSFYPGIEGLHRIYKEDEFASRNIRHNRYGFCCGRRLLDWACIGRVDCLFSRLKNSVKRYEGQDSMQHFTDVPIMCKDPYYATTSFKALAKQVSQQCSGSRKRKLATVSKAGKKASVNSEAALPPAKKVVKVRKAAHSELVGDAPSSLPPNTSPICSLKVKKEVPLPTRASNRLKAKFIQKIYPPSSFSSHVVVQASNSGEPAPNDEVVQESPLSVVPGDIQQNSPVHKVLSPDGANPTASDQASTSNSDPAATSQDTGSKALSIVSPTNDDVVVSNTPAPDELVMQDAVTSCMLSIG